MACEIEKLSLSVPEGISVKEVDKANIGDYLSAFASGWEVPNSDLTMTKSQVERSFTLSSKAVKFFVAYRRKTPVGTAGFVLKSDFAFLTGGNVHSFYRGQCIYKALIAEGLRFLGVPLNEPVEPSKRNFTSTATEN